ncbi:hypothetical protein BP312_03369 [Bordetella pertussis]|nr:hypothetical protein BP312_03369 [Bordetella pertussis]
MNAPDGILAHDAGAAEDADGLLADRHRGLAGDQLDARRGGGVQRALIDAPGAVIDQPAGRLDLRRHVGQLVRDGLVFAHALAGDEAVVGEAGRRVERRARHAQRIGRHADPVLAQRFQDQRIGAFGFAQQAVVGNESVVDMDQRGFGCAYAFLFQLGDVEAGVGQLDDEQADRLRLECRAGARGHQQKVGEGRVGDVQLAAVQAPAALDALGAGLHGAHVGAAVRLAQAEPGHFPAGQRGGQEARFLGRRAGFPDRPDAEVGVGRPGRGECLRQITEFFAHNAVADLVQAAAAVGLGVAHAQQAQLAPALEYAPGKGLLFFGLEHQGGELFLAEPPHGVPYGFVFAGKGKAQAHGSAPLGCTAAHGARQANRARPDGACRYSL